ncbi:hypothetical protein FACS1894218_6260 [Bacilli bacterium]|nr:hypothetical protein FACS1894218_6260 [Bacilli bacterium]
MKLKKTLFGILTAAGICTVATTTITSCSTVDSAIMKNMVDPTKGGGRFSADTSLNDEITTALTDESATDAFKKSVVNKILTR